MGGVAVLRGPVATEVPGEGPLGLARAGEVQSLEAMEPLIRGMEGEVALAVLAHDDSGRAAGEFDDVPFRHG